jgi:hypothetical protein
MTGGVAQAMEEDTIAVSDQRNQRLRLTIVAVANRSVAP